MWLPYVDDINVALCCASQPVTACPQLVTASKVVRGYSLKKGDCDVRVQEGAQHVNRSNLRALRESERPRPLRFAHLLAVGHAKRGIARYRQTGAGWADCVRRLHRGTAQ
jgi:hypothetical protein